jgi:hypothetical protein
MYRRQDIDAYLDSLAETAGNGRWQRAKRQPDDVIDQAAELLRTA